MMFFEASAKTADHVNECFMNLTASIVKELEKSQVKKKPDNPQANIDLGKQSAGQGQRGKGGCC
jgi:GTPase SAR1 family protein